MSLVVVDRYKDINDIWIFVNRELVNFFGVSPLFTLHSAMCRYLIRWLCVYHGVYRVCFKVCFLSKHIVLARFLSLSRKSHGYILYECRAFRICRANDNSVFLSGWLSSHLQE